MDEFKEEREKIKTASPEQKWKYFKDYYLKWVIAGGIGNMIDRIAQDYVIDYISFVLIHFPIFNFADICAVVGTFLFIFVIFFGKDEFDNFWNAIRGIFKKNA